jgi:hypothetical protein
MTGKTLGGKSFSNTPDVNGNLVLVATPGQGLVLQSVFQAVASQSGTSVLAFANTTPVVANGTQVWTQTITPKLATSNINLNGTFSFDAGANSRTLIVMLFRGSVCIGVTEAQCVTSGRTSTVSFNVNDAPGSTASQTYSIRVAMSQSGTWYVNQSSTPYFNGALALSGVTVMEMS